MPTVLVTGANRGLGLEFARQYRADDWNVIATARDPGDAAALRATGAEVFALDTADEASIAALAKAIAAAPVDVLIANAGVYGRDADDAAGWARVLATNAIGPTLLAQALKPNLLEGSERKVIAITSQMGSIADNSSGRHIPYRSSKAALNASWKSLAVDWRGEGIVAAVFNPGWVQTDMGGPNARITPQTSVSGMRRVIAGLTQRESGRFWNYDGREFEY